MLWFFVVLRFVLFLTREKRPQNYNSELWGPGTYSSPKSLSPTASGKTQTNPTNKHGLIPHVYSYVRTGGLHAEKSKLYLKATGSSTFIFFLFFLKVTTNRFLDHGCNLSTFTWYTNTHVCMQNNLHTWEFLTSRIYCSATITVTAVAIIRITQYWFFHLEPQSFHHTESSARWELAWNQIVSHNMLSQVHLLRTTHIAKITLKAQLVAKLDYLWVYLKLPELPAVYSLWVTLQCISFKWGRCVEIFKSLVKPWGF